MDKTEASREKEEAKGCFCILPPTPLNAQGNTADGLLKDFLLPSPFWHLEYGVLLLLLLETTRVAGTVFDVLPRITTLPHQFRWWFRAN